MVARLILVCIQQGPLLTESQLKVIIDIAIAAAQLLLASLVLPFVVPGFDQAQIAMILFGSITALSSWLGAIGLARKVNL